MRFQQVSVAMQKKGRSLITKSPPCFDIQFLNVSLPTPLSRVIGEYVSVSPVVFHSFLEFLNVSLGCYIVAHDNNIVLLFTLRISAFVASSFAMLQLGRTMFDA